MANGFAPTIFSGSGDDSLVVQDAYSLDGSSRLNQTVQKATDGLIALGRNVLENPSLLMDLTSMVSQAKNGYSRAQIISRLAWVLGPSGNQVINNLGGDMADSLFSALGVSEETAKTFKVTIGNEIERLVYYNGSYDQPHQWADLMGRVLGNSELAKVVDLEAEAAFLSSLINQSMQFGLYEALPLFRESSSNAYSWQKAYWDSTPTIIYSANLSAIAELVSASSGAVVLGKVPDAISIILRNFAMAENTSVNLYPGLRNQLLGVLSSIDPEWDTYTRAVQYQVEVEGEELPQIVNSTAVRFDAFQFIGEAAAKLLSGVEKYQPAIVLANRYGSSTLVDAGNALYPGLSL